MAKVVKQAELLIQGGAQSGERFPLAPGAVVIGRGDTCAVRLTDHLVSREHTRVERADGGYRVLDLESKNGTFLNGVAVTSKLLRAGDKIQVGGTTLVFVTIDPGKAPPASVSAVSLASRPWGDLVFEESATCRPAEDDGDSISPALERQAAKMARRCQGQLRGATKTGDFAVAARAVLDAALDATAASRATLFEIDTDLGEITRSFVRIDRPIDGDSTIGLDDRIRIDAALVERSIEAGESVLVLRSVDLSANPTDEAPVSGAVIPVPPEAGATLALYLDTGVRDDALLSADDLTLATELAFRVGPTLASAILLRKVQEERDHLRGELVGKVGLIGQSEPMQKQFEQIERLAAVDSPVLITGESGTGKELVARAIHYGSARAGEPFVAVNVAAVPTELVESELFGHTRGAFTGAVRPVRGRLEEAGAGTLFLDEIGELSPDAQVKLLRVLEERTFRPLGSGRDMPFRARLLAATNRDLPALIPDGRFREDFYFRLAVVELRLPPLRERGDDIVELATHFLVEIGNEVGRPGVTMATDAANRLAGHHWPGNVRELKNAIERALVLGTESVLGADDFAFLDLARRIAEKTGQTSSGEVPRPRTPTPLTSSGMPTPRAPRTVTPSHPEALGEAVPSPSAPTPAAPPGVAPAASEDAIRPLREMERLWIENALRACGGNKSKAARLLGIDRSTLYDKIKQHGFDA